MRKILFLFCLLLVAGTAAPAVATPRLAVQQADFDFGRVFAGQKVEHVFSFRNRGDTPLHIAKVRTSCGCTAALVSAKVVPPGGRGQVRASFDSSRFHGPVHKMIFLYTDDRSHPIFQFNLRGVVRPQLVAKPARIDLGTIAAGGFSRVAVELVNEGKGPVTLLDVRTTAPELKAELHPGRLAPGARTTLTVRAVAGQGGRWLTGYIIIHTRGTAMPRLYLPATVRIK